MQFRQPWPSPNVLMRSSAGGRHALGKGDIIRFVKFKPATLGARVQVEVEEGPLSACCHNANGSSSGHSRSTHLAAPISYTTFQVSPIDEGMCSIRRYKLLTETAVRW